MKTRIISGVIGLVLLAVIMFTGQLVLGIAIMLISWIGLHEFYTAVSKAGYKPVKSLGYSSSLVILFIALNEQFNIIPQEKTVGFVTLGIFAIILVQFSMMIFTNNKYNIVDMSVSFYGIVYIVFLFSCLLLTRELENGMYYIWLVFIGAFMTDTCAYFTGRLIGKTKRFIPAIVPTKTLEGCIGGVVGCIAGMLAYGMFVQTHIEGISLIHYIFLGILCGVISQIGDWSASAIKRFVKIKDYGKIMPGHGGVLDRFDSILFVAPVVYFYLTLVV